MESFSTDKNTVNGYPSDYVPSEVKDTKDYGLKYAKAIWAEHERQNSLYNSRIGRYIVNRKYAEGLQSVEKYKTLMGVEGDTSYMNLDYNPPPIIPKFIDIIVGRLINRDYKITCTPIDAQSRVKMDDYLDELRAKRFLKPVAEQIEPKTGVPLIPKGGAPILDSEEEEDLHMQLNYKMDESIAMEEAIEWVRNNNNSSEIEERVIRDLVVCKIGAIRDYYDENFNLCSEYVDPVDLIVPYSKEPDFANIPRVAIKKMISIQDLARMAPEFTEEDLFDIAQNVAGKYNNENWRWGNNYQYYAMKSAYGDREYNSYLVGILDFEFMSTNTLTYAKTEKEGGNGYYFDKKRSDYQVPERSKHKKTIANRTLDVKYQGKWVIGTKYLFTYGKAQNQIRPMKNGIPCPKTEFSVKIFAPNIYDMENKSLCERMIPFADQIALCHLKSQQLVGKIRPPGLAIDVRGLQGVVKGMGTASLKDSDIVEMYDQTGNFLYNSRDAGGDPINNSVIQEIHTSVAGELNALIAMYQYNLGLIRDVTGINEVVDASSPDPKALNGTSQLSVQASNNATRSLNNAYLSLVTRSAKAQMLMIQDSIEKDNEAFINAIGKDAVEILKMGKNVPLCEFGIEVEFLPDDQEQAELRETLNYEIQTGGLRSEDAILVRQEAKKNVKLAARLLIYRKKKYAQERMEEAQANSDAQTQSAIQASDAKTQGDAQILQMQTQAEVAKAKAIMELEMGRDAKLHQYKLEEIALMNQGKVEVTHATHQGNLMHTAFENATQPVTTGP